jgi:hypothetical protein
MSQDAFHLQNTTTLDWTINGTTFAVAAVQNVTVSISSSIVELESGDSIFREAHYHESMRFPVSISQARFDHDIVTEVFGTPATGATSVIEDRSELPELSLSGTFNGGERGSTKVVELTVDNIPFPESFPIFDLTTSEYGTFDIEADGATLSKFDVTA